MHALRTRRANHRPQPGSIPLEVANLHRYRSDAYMH
jgi:hypothetical protein